MDLFKTLPESNDGTSSVMSEFKALFDKSYAGLVFYSFKIVGDRQDAEDIVQDAFVNYWNQKKAVSEEVNAIKSFLYNTVRNASFNLLRHQKVVRKFEE